MVLTMMRAASGSRMVHFRPNPVQYAALRSRLARGEVPEAMGGIRLITALYALFFVLMVLVAIGSILGLFDNPLIDPGL
jgi:hypothetical protein